MKRLWFIISERPGFRVRSYGDKEPAMRAAEKLWLGKSIGEDWTYELHFHSPTKGPIKVGEIGMWGWKWEP